MRKLLLKRKKNSVVVGGITFDEIYTDSVFTKFDVGGGAYYSSKTLKYLGLEPLILTSMSILQKNILEQRSLHRIYYYETNTPLIFRLIYSNGERELYLISPGKTIPEALLPSGVYDFAIVNPVYHEVGINLMKKIRHYSKIVALDLQGLVRNINEEHKIVLEYHDSIHDYISYADIIHADYREFVTFTQKENIHKAIDYITKTNQDKIWLITYGEKPIIIVYSGKTYYFDPPKIGEAIDETGAGDTMLAAFTYYYTENTEISYCIEKTLAIINLKLKGLI